MNENKICVLHIVGMMNVGGVQKFLLDLYRNIDKNNIQFSFAVQREYPLFYDDEIYALGGDLYFLPLMEKNILKYSLELYKLLKKNTKYKIVHIHLNRRNVIPLLIAKLAGVPIRIAHSHSKAEHNNKFKRFQVKLIKFTINMLSTHRFACSVDAGNYLFGKKDFSVIKNGIDTDKFKYTLSIRQNLRRTLGIQDKFVYGHVGNFATSKNYFFLIDVFILLQSENPDAVLLLVGDGVLFNQIQDYIKEKRVESYLILVGNVDNVHEYMQAMDAFIFPSVYEGFGIVAIEAQSVGLPVFASDTIPEEVKLTNNISFIPLIEGKEFWANVIKVKVDEFKRYDKSNIIKNKGYDVKVTSKDIEDIYRDIFSLYEVRSKW